MMTSKPLWTKYISSIRRDIQAQHCLGMDVELIPLRWSLFYQILFYVYQCIFDTKVYIKFSIICYHININVYKLHYGIILHYTWLSYVVCCMSIYV